MLCTPDFKSKIKILVEKALEGDKEMQSPSSHAQSPTMVGQSPAGQSPSTVKVNSILNEKRNYLIITQKYFSQHIAK